MREMWVWRRGEGRDTQVLDDWALKRARSCLPTTIRPDRLLAAEAFPQRDNGNGPAALNRDGQRDRRAPSGNEAWAKAMPRN